MEFLEESTAIDLESRVLEVGAYLESVSSQECRNVVFAPLVIPILLFECLSNLTFLVIGTLNVSDEVLSSSICLSNW